LDKRLVTDQLVLTVGYDRENLANYRGELMMDRYGRAIPKHAHGTINLKQQTSSSKGSRCHGN
jgi:DNA polymerase V